MKWRWSRRGLAVGLVSVLALLLFPMDVRLNAPRPSMHKPGLAKPYAHWECRADPVAAEAATAAQSAQDAIDTIDALCGGVTDEQIAACSVPNMVHFTLVNTKTFGFYAYVAVKSAHDRLHPDGLYLHLMEFPVEPTEYLDRAIREFGLKIVRSRKVTHVYDRPVAGITHFSDIVRIESMIRFGGIYLDLDAFVLKPLDDMYRFETVIPSENNNGLASGIMLAKRCSRFLTTWYNMYDTFDDSQWGFHPVVLPWRLAQLIPQHIQIENVRIQTNFWDTYRKCFSSVLERSYWEPVRIVHPYVRLAEETYDEQSIQKLNNNFGVMIRRILANKPGMSDEW